MALYGDEEEVYKCLKHPSRHRRTCGVCPVCLTNRLSALCPDCALALPCQCCPASTTSSSSSSSSRFSSDAPSCSGGGVRVFALIAGEPAFRRSRSVAAVPFLRSRFAPDNRPDNSKPSIWSFLKIKREKGGNKSSVGYNTTESLMTRSKSVAGSATSSKGSATSSIGKGWYFPSPMKAFRQTKTAKVVQEQSPLYRG